MPDRKSGIGSGKGLTLTPYHKSGTINGKGLTFTHQQMDHVPRSYHHVLGW